MTETRRTQGLIRTGLLATLVAMVVTTLAAALAKAAGVDFELPDGGDTIPLPGFAVVTGVFSLIGIAIAAAFRRWSPRPAQHFTWTAITLTALSLVPAFLSQGNAATITTLLALHLIAAAVMIPPLTRSLRTEKPRT